MKAVSVLGAGELGKACALALAANGVASVRLLSRDVLLAAPEAVPPRDTADHLSSPSAGSTRSPPSTSSAWPPAIQLCDVKKAALPGSATAAADSLFICTPITSYLAPDDAWAKTALGPEHSPVTHQYLQSWGRAVRSSMLAGSSATKASSETTTPFVCTFTRGFAADGGVPAQLAEELLNGEGEASTSDAVPIPVLVAAGPLLAQEWALQCTPLACQSTSTHTSIPPRPRSALSAAGRDDDIPQQQDVSLSRADNRTGVSAATAAGTAASSGALSYPHAFSGAALTFAAWPPSTHADAGRQEALAHRLTSLFPRESVTYLREPDAAAVLSIVNGCVPLCAFGAGLVSSVYTGASVSAQAAYAQHATAATEQLVNGLLGRRPGTPLPIAACSTLHCACTAFASREFALGRQLDFYFRKQDAVQAIFRGRTHHVFAATVDGLHTRLQAARVSSTFYEVLMDTYNTMIRASQAGEGLVKAGHYDYRGAAQGGAGSLLHHTMRVDAAMLSGDEDRFTAAKEHFVKAFPGAVIQ